MTSKQAPPDDEQKTTPKANLSAYLSFGARQSSLRKSIVKQWQQKLFIIADDAARVPGMCTSKVNQSTNHLTPKTSAETSNTDTTSTASISQSFSPTTDEKDDFASWLDAQDFDASAIYENGENPNLDISHISGDFPIFSPDQQATDTNYSGGELAAKRYGVEGLEIEQGPDTTNTSKEAVDDNNNLDDNEVRKSKFAGWNLSNLNEIMETIINANCQCWGASKNFNLGDINVLRSDENDDSENEGINQNLTKTPKSAYTSRSNETSIISINSLQLESGVDVIETDTKSPCFETPKIHFSYKDNESSSECNDVLEARNEIHDATQRVYVIDNASHRRQYPQKHRVGNDALSLSSNSFREGELRPIPEEKTIKNKVEEKYGGFSSTSPCTINYNFSSDEFSSSTPGKRSPLVGEQYVENSRNVSNNITQPVLTPLRHSAKDISSPMTPLHGEGILLDDFEIDGARASYVNSFLASPVNLTDRYSSPRGKSTCFTCCPKGCEDNEKQSDHDSVVISSSDDPSQNKSPVKEKRMQWVKERRRRKFQC